MLFHILYGLIIFLLFLILSILFLCKNRIYVFLNSYKTYKYGKIFKIFLKLSKSPNEISNKYEFFWKFLWYHNKYLNVSWNYHVAYNVINDHFYKLQFIQNKAFILFFDRIWNQSWIFLEALFLCNKIYGVTNSLTHILRTFSFYDIF